MAKYKIESTYLQFPIILETESNDEAFEMFTAYCDYQGVFEDDIECEYDDEGISNAVVEQMGKDEEEDECIARFQFTKIE